MKRALFIDRDGVINRMVRYQDGFDSPLSPNEVKLVTGVEKVIKFANGRRIPVIEISNRPQVAKGKTTKQMSKKVENKIHKLLKDKGARIDMSYICPHHPNAILLELRIICDCRKPKPGLLLKAAKENNIDLKKSVFLGDKATDVKAGKLAGCKTVLFLHDNDEPLKVKDAKKAKADYKVKSMREALSLAKKLLKTR